MDSPLETGMNRRNAWQAFDEHTPGVSADYAHALRPSLEAARALEAHIDAAAEELKRRVGALLIMAIAEGRNTIPLLHSTELDFIDDLPAANSAPGISDRHRRLLQDMKLVDCKLRPMLIKSAGHDMTQWPRDGWRFDLTEAAE